MSIKKDYVIYGVLALGSLAGCLESDSADGEGTDFGTNSAADSDADTDSDTDTDTDGDTDIGDTSVDTNPDTNPSIGPPPAVDTDTTPAVCPAEGTVVERNGRLKVTGNQLQNACGAALQLKGPSSMWLNWENDGFAESHAALKWMRDNWHATLIRASMGVDVSGAYLDAPERALTQVTGYAQGMSGNSNWSMQARASSGCCVAGSYSGAM